MTSFRANLARGLVATSLLITAPACITPAHQRQRQLIDTARDFNNDLRWGRFETAVTNLAPAEAKLFLARVELLNDELVIADQEITDLKVGNPDTKAVTHVRLDWYTQRDPVVRRTFVEQRWQWDGRWLVTGQRRTRGDRFPLVPEAADPAKVADPGKTSAAGPSPPPPGADQPTSRP